MTNIPEKYWAILAGHPRSLMMFRLDDLQFNKALGYRDDYFTEKKVANSTFDPLISVVDLTGAVVGIDVSKILRYYQMSQKILDAEGEYEEFEKSAGRPNWE